jgi:hypothetical protein
VTIGSSTGRIETHIVKFHFYLHVNINQGSAGTSSVIEDTLVLMKIKVLRDVTPPGGRYLQMFSTSFLRKVSSYLPVDKA